MWTTMAKHFLDLVLLAIILGIAYGFGRRILALMRIRFTYPVEAAACSIGIGLAALAYGIFIVGILGWLNRSSVIMLLGLMILLSTPLVHSAKRLPGANIYAHIPERLLKARTNQNAIEGLTTAACILILLLAFLCSLSPPTITEWDSLSYHLAIPKLYLKAGRIYFVRFTSHASFPFTTEMLYTAGLALSGHTLAKLFHLTFFLGCAMLLLCIGNSLALHLWRQEHNDDECKSLPSPTRAGWASSWALFTIPIAVAEASTAYIDVALSFYTLLFTHAVLQWFSTFSFGWLALAGIACGICMGIKYSGVLTILLLLCAALLSRFMRRDIRHPSAILIHTIAAIAIAIIVASPWYVKNIVLTGNPFFPFFYEVFGGRGWNERMAEQYRRHQLEFGTKRNPLQFLIAPWNLTMRSDVPKGLNLPGREPIKYEVEPNPTSGIGLTFLAIIPTLIFARPISPYAVLVLILCGIWFSAWFFSVQYLRYLLPCIIMLCGIVGYAYSHWFERSYITRAVAQAAMLIAVLYSLLIAFSWALPSIPAALGIVSEDEYLRQTLPSYSIARYINLRLPKDAKVITYGEPLCYYFERDYLWGDPGHNLLIDYEMVARSKEPMKALFESYRKLGVTHVLLNGRYFSLELKGVPNELLRGAIETNLLRQLVSIRGEELYEIDWEAVNNILGKE